jgi:hypothetical protein
MEVWLDGGWRVDALLGHQQRRHDDLDPVVELADVPRLREVLTKNGYAVLGGAPPINFTAVVNESGSCVRTVAWLTHSRSSV